jgi:hypothetical protein
MEARDFAHSYIDLGCALKLLRPRDKGVPLVPKDPARAQQQGWSARAIAGRLATHDHDVVDEVFDRLPDANVAIVTGKASGGLVGLDIDPRNGGDASLDRLEAEHGPLPAVPSVETWSGGRHYYFSDAGLAEKTRKDVPEFSGIDIQRDNVHLVAPPSIIEALDLVSGMARCGQYRWVRPPLVTTHLAGNLPQLPAWLASRIAINKPRSHIGPCRGDVQVRTRSLQALVDTLRATHEGNRQAMAYWCAKRAEEGVQSGAYAAHEGYAALEAAMYAIGCDATDVRTALRDLRGLLK